MKAFSIVVALISVGAAAFFVLQTKSRVVTDTQTGGNDMETSRDVEAMTRPLNRPALLLRKTDAESNSYFGGAPPAYSGLTWPTRKGRPLGFLACIDLASLPSDSGIDWLPTDGRLLFYYDIKEQPWGFDPHDRDGWKVVYVPAKMEVSGESTPPANLKTEWQLKKRGVEFVSVALPPAWERAEIAALKLTDAEMNEFIDFRWSLYGNHPHHQIGGYPNPIQHPNMDLECQLVSNGLYCGDLSGYEDPKAKELAKGASDWELLLQMDSDDDINAMWGDVGMLYFWIRREDARNKTFDGTWMILQCG